MKRGRHRWLGFSLFCIIVVILSTELPTTSAVKATSLFFAKTSSTTAAPEEVPTAPEDGAEPETTAEGDEVPSNATKYTGIPQIDYILDPNLPRELNGYNLSEYPFYETVPKPETMDFKCDGLHDGFYASVPHKCQVYHHCLYGTRYDFLCANYTAFDQKTFICHFVSEVDCKNSPNYFSRNEALYKQDSTTTPAPPSTSSTTTTTTQRPTRPPRRRPYYRYDYYDEDDYYNPRDDYDYEDRRRPRPARPGRPGKKKRPVDDYEDDRYDRRPEPRDKAPDDYEDRDRRPYDRRPAKRPRPYDDEDRRPYRPNRRPRPRDEEEDRYMPDDEDRPRGQRDERPKRPREETRPRDEIKPRDEIRPRDEIKPRDEIRPRDETKPRDSIRPRDQTRPREESGRDETRPREEVRPRDQIRPRDEIKPRDEARPADEDRRGGTRSREERRPLRDDTTRPREDRYQNEGRRHREDRPYRGRDERPYAKPDRKYDEDESQTGKREIPSAPEGQALVKPNGHGLFSQPRAPPKISRPVPAVEKQKYQYVPVTTTKSPPKVSDDEYYDYEEEETNKPLSSGKTSTVQRAKLEVVEKEKFKPTRLQYNGPKGIKTKRPIDYDDDYYYEKTEKPQRPKTNERKKLSDDYYYDYDDKKDEKPKQREVEQKKERPTFVVVNKRPFLPSRGGSPYLPRGLQPVAGKDVTAPINTTPKPTTTTPTTTTPSTTTPTTTSTTSTTTTTTTTTSTTTTTTPKPTTQRTVSTLKPTIITGLTAEEDEYEYYDEDDIDYHKKKDITTEIQTTSKIAATSQPETTTLQLTTPDQRLKLATKVLRVYNDNYEAIREKLKSTLTPGDYIKPYLATAIPAVNKIEPEISKPYTATGKPVIPDDISIKQNLADSIENDYDVRLNEALAPSLPVSRVPSGFVPTNRDYTFARFRSNVQTEPTFAASDNTYQVRKHPQVNIRTPSSYYLQPQRLGYQEDSNRFPRHLVLRLGDYY